MIAPFFAALITFFVSALGFGLFGAGAFFALFCLYATLLYVVTFERNRPLYIGALTGVTFAVELLTPVRPGLAVIFALLLLVGQNSSSQYLTVTAPINRFIISLFWMTLIYLALLYPLATFWQGLRLLSLPFAILGIIFFIFYTSNLSSRYERS